MILKNDKKYEDQVQDLLQENAYYLPWGEKAVTTLLAMENETVIGVGSLWNNSLHPHRAYIDVYVQPAFRRQGIGTSLFQQLASFSPLGKFQAAVSSKDIAAVAFLEKSGFQVARKCYTPNLENKGDSLPTPDKPATAFRELTATQQAELIQLQLKNYKQFHQAINPLKDSIAFETWQEIVLEGLDETHSFVLMKEGKVEAYLLTYAGEQEQALDIGYVGGKDLAQLDEYLPFYRSVTDRLITQFETVSIEADDVDPFAFALLEEFEYDKSDSWDTYLL